MKKTVALLMILADFSIASASFANEILGYPVTPTQTKFYLLILGLLGVSVAMVSAAYFAFWVLDLRKKRARLPKPAVREGKVFAGGFAVAGQSAK